MNKYLLYQCVLQLLVRLGVINTMWSLCSRCSCNDVAYSHLSLSHTHTHTLYCLSLSSLQSSSLRTKVEKYCVGRAAGKPTLLYKQTIMFNN